MIHLKFYLNQIKFSKSFDFSKKNECITLVLITVRFSKFQMKEDPSNAKQ